MWMTSDVTHTRQQTKMSARKDMRLLRESEAQSFNSVMARGSGSKQRLIREYSDNVSDSDDEGSLESLDEEYLYSLNQKTKSMKRSSDCRLCVVSVVSFIIIVILVCFIAWQHFTHQDLPCSSAECVLTSAYILAKMNTTQEPCDDFYEYACGGWLENTLIPPDKAKYGAFAEVEKQNKDLLRKVLEMKGSMYKGNHSTAIEKIKTYYENCMDRETVEELGIEPALRLIKKLGSWSVTSDTISGTWDEATWKFLDTLVELHSLFRPVLFSLTVGQDDKNSSKNIIQIEQSGLTLAERNEYLGNNSEKFKTAFLGFATKLGELLGGDNSTEEKMLQVYEFEKGLAEIFMPKEELEDPVATYHKMTLEQFQSLIGSQIPMKAYVDQLFKKNIPLSEEVLVYTVDYFSKLGAVIEKTPKEVLANYMVWQMMNVLPGYLPETFIDAALILTKAETGVSEVSPRWQRCVFKTSDAAPFAIGALFVQESFSPTSKQIVVDTIDDIKKAFESNLHVVDWMDDQTKNIAIDKVKAVTDMIAYPEYILNPSELDHHYENLTIQKGQFLASRLFILAFQKQWHLLKLGKTPDRTEWSMGPAEVNAYYSPTNNQIVFPAGILQKPFFDPQFPLSFRYGSLGMIVGHELTHGFDNKGRNYDKYGNLQSWWTNASADAFEQKAECMKDQYSAYTVAGDVHLNGDYTLGENIADNGGLKTAYTAYQKEKLTADEQVKLPGMDMTPEQLFYVGFAQIWCSYYTPEYARQTVLTDVHANAKYRVIGSVSNSEDFAATFKCAANAPMNPQHKCPVW